MLILTRKVGEDVLITIPDGRVILVRIADVRPGSPGRARIGFEAPSDVAIHRREVHEAIIGTKPEALDA